MAELNETVRKALQEPHFWHLATVNPDGSPHSTTMWVDLRGDRILVNSAYGRKKPRNLAKDGRVALSWHDPEAPYHSISIQGRVAETYEGDAAEADIDLLAKKYLGQDVYPWRQGGERRVTYLVEPSHVLHMAP